MANYLPVLLVSVSTNAIPDDSSVSTLPRSQVDYLSHEWREEDVWRSWRNMTRQKNEIANGIRLENASWRTWWKQRNKLKTVTPETLNWLKDSDVTWLYGPLHTAVDWSPPPRPNLPPSSVDDKPCPTPTQDRLDLSIPDRSLPKHKPILKYRSISELLLSDLPPSPVFSPTESEEDDRQAHPEQSGEPDEDPTQKAIRPTLMHTKSDTHISRWGPNRAFRKDSPPRINPPGHNPINSEGYTDSSSDPPNHTTSSAQQPAKRKHILFNTYVEQCIAIEKPRKASVRYGESGDWDVRRPNWQYDDGYEEDQGESDDEVDAFARSESTKIARASHTRYPVEGAVASDSDSPFDGDYDNAVFEDDDEDEDEAIGEEGDQQIEFRSGKRSQSTFSTASSSSSSATTTSESPSNSPPRKARRREPIRPPPRQRRGSVYATYSPKTHTVSTPANVATGEPVESSRTTSPNGKLHTGSRRSSHSHDHGYHHHVTIAPIAPTILKTTCAGEDGDRDIEFGSLASTYGFMYGYGDNDHGKGYGAHKLAPTPFGWRDGFGDDNGDGGSDDGLSALTGMNQRNWDARQSPVRRRASTGADFHGDHVRPVDLVYVPSVGHQYGLRLARNHPGQPGRQSLRHSRNQEPRENVYIHTEAHLSQDDHPSTISAPIPIVNANAPPSPTSISSESIITPKSVPIVVEPHGIVGESVDYLGGAELVEDLPRGRSSSRYLSESIEDKDRSGRRGRHSGDRPSRSRSKSHSRTPSPALLAGTTNNQEAVGAIPIPKKRETSFSPPSGPTPASAPPTSLLSPPTRGRSQSSRDEPPQRGRSATRTTPSPTFLEERSRSRSSHGSPMGSLSPDSGMTGSGTALYGVSANGRGSSRSESQSTRRGERGRETTKKRISQGSPSAVTSAAIPPSIGRIGGTAGVIIPANEITAGAPATSDTKVMPTQGNVPADSTQVAIVPSQPIAAASTSSIPPAGDTESDRAIADTEAARSMHPTPSNSPIIATSMTKFHPSQHSSNSDPATTTQLRDDIPPLSPPATPSNVPSNTHSSGPTSRQPATSCTPSSHSMSAPTTTPSANSPPSASTAASSPALVKSPLTVAPPLPAGPSTSYENSFSPDERSAHAVHSPTSPTRTLASIVGSRLLGSPPPRNRQPSQKSEAGDSPTSIVGKAVEIVSNAGAYFGLWHATANPTAVNTRSESSGNNTG